ALIKINMCSGDAVTSPGKAAGKQVERFAARIGIYN